MPSFRTEPADDWSDAVDEARGVLASVARDRGTVTYGELCRSISSLRLTPRSRLLTRLLGEVCALEDADRGIMLGSLVVRASDGMPGEGYFRHAEELGRDVSDRKAFWRGEVQRVWAAWEGREG